MYDVNYTPKHANKNQIIINLYQAEIQNLIDPKTDMLDHAKTMQFAKQLVDQGNQCKDPFWVESATNCLAACIGLAGFRREEFIFQMYEKLGKAIGVKPVCTTDIPRMLPNQRGFIVQTLREYEKKIMEAAKKKDMNLNEVQQAIDEIHFVAPSITIGTIYQIANCIDEYVNEFHGAPWPSIARCCYNIYESALSEKARSVIHDIAVYSLDCILSTLVEKHFAKSASNQAVINETHEPDDTPQVACDYDAFNERIPNGWMINVDTPGQCKPEQFNETTRGSHHGKGI